jgi:type VI secretion system protein ImpA
MTTTTEVIDIEALLAPIPGDKPSGESLQYAGLYDEIREARRSEEEGEFSKGSKSANWNQVIQLATDALTNKTKDLQVAAWLVEAVVQRHGFHGIRDSFKLFAGLLERFWDSLYPENDEGDLEARANSIAWMDRQLASIARTLPLTNNPIGDNYGYLNYEESVKFDIPDNYENLEFEQRQRYEQMKQQAADEGKITSEQWRTGKARSRRAFYEELNKSLNSCWEQFVILDRTIDEKFDRQTPGLGAVKKALEDIRSCIDKIVKEKRLLEPDEVATEEGETVAEAASGGSGGRGPVKTRQEALKRLADVADFFRKTEPHSPVSYLINRAIKWGNMPLESWLQDVVKDGTVLDTLKETLGLNTPGSES